MSTPTAPPPGWYPNPQGELQWWDGTAWGARTTQQFSPPITTTTPPKPRVSKLVWISFCLSALALLCMVAAALASYANLEASFVEYGYHDSSMPETSWAAASGVLSSLAPVLAIASVVLAITGLVRSQKKRAGVFALILSAVALFAPVLLVIAGLVWWFGTGAFSQLTGGSFG